jgi:hypothetical protein
MDCKQFNTQLADWLGDKLSPSVASTMEQHRKSCAACSRLADSEAELRRLFGAWTTTPNVPDLRSRVASRIERVAQRPLWFPGFRWSFAAAGALAVIVFTTINLPPQPVPDSKHGPLTMRVSPPVVSGPPLPIPTVFDVSVSDPAVDDPAGGNMEPVWSHVDQVINK